MFCYECDLAVKSNTVHTYMYEKIIDDLILQNQSGFQTGQLLIRGNAVTVFISMLRRDLIDHRLSKRDIKAENRYKSESVSPHGWVCVLLPITANGERIAYTHILLPSFIANLSRNLCIGGRDSKIQLCYSYRQ